MVGRAKSVSKKQQIQAEEKERWMLRGIEIYQDDQGSDGKKKSLRQIVKMVQEESFEDTGKMITIDKSTLCRRAQGFRSIRDFNASKALLTPEEEKVVVDYGISMAQRGWPLNHRRLREHVEEICVAKYGQSFIDRGLGINWTDRLVERNSKRFKPFWSHALDTSRARGANPFTKEAFFTLLKDVRFGGEDAITPDLIYGVDETGIQQGVGGRERVYGPADAKVQQQQRSGNRENITVIVTICADGTSLAPAVIFKGEAFQLSWKQNNPLNCSIGHSKKGYTDGEIGVEWIKNFDKQTKRKAGSRQRLLLVDGHNSHYTRGFIEYARENRIHVLCYPSHSTHLYQGLDVVIFSVLKRRWTEIRDKYERKTKQKVTKSNFLELYGDAHVLSLTTGNIISAFEKTGIVPYNPHVITAEMMAPSLETSTSAVFPLPVDESVVILSQMIQKEVKKRKRSRTIGSNNSQPLSSEGTSPHRRVRQRRTQADPPSLPESRSSAVEDAVTALTSTPMAYLLNSSPIRSTHELPLHLPYPFSPSKNRYQALLDQPARTEHERELHTALHEAQGRIEAQKALLTGMQATSVLQGMYLQQTRMQLEAQEESAKQKRGNRLFGDGMPKLLDGDEFHARVVAAEEEAADKAAAAAQRKTIREQRAILLADWKKNDAARKARNSERRKKFAPIMEKWKAEKECARKENRRPRWAKPKISGIEGPIPRPVSGDAQDDESEPEGEQADAENEVDD